MNTVEEEFLAWSEKDRLRSPATIIKYKTVLQSLRQFADPATATIDDLEAWWQSRYDKAPATRTAELACLKAFYKYLTAFDHRPDDPTRRTFAPKKPIRVPRMVGRSDFERLLGDLTADSPSLRRAYALGGYAGLRVAEVANLDWKNIDVEQRRIYIIGKGNKERMVPINTSLMDILLPAYKEGNVLRPNGDPYSPGVLQRKVNRHMAKCGVDHTFHDFRKRGASILLAKGASLAAVRKMFGWASMETVASYAVVSDNELDVLAEMLN